MINLSAHFQLFLSENSNNGCKHMAGLLNHTLIRWLGGSGIRFQWFMEDFDLPPFFVGCRDGVPVRFQITASQIHNARASIFVCKDLGWLAESGNPSPSANLSWLPVLTFGVGLYGWNDLVPYLRNFELPSDCSWGHQWTVCFVIA